MSDINIPKEGSMEFYPPSPRLIEYWSTGVIISMVM